MTQMLQNRSTDRDYKVILSHNSASPNEIYWHYVSFFVAKSVFICTKLRANGKSHSHHSPANVV